MTPTTRPTAAPGAKAPARSACPSIAALVRADLHDTWYYWLLTGLLTGINGLIGVGIAGFTADSFTLVIGDETVRLHTMTNVIFNWVISWTIVLLVSGIIRATNTTAIGALAGAGLKLQNRAGWAADAAHALGAAAVLTALRAVSLRAEGPGMNSLQILPGPWAGSLGAATALVEALIFCALWLVFAGIGRIIGHAFRIGPAPVGILAIIGYVAACMGIVWAAAALSRSDSDAWLLPFGAVLGAFLLAVFPLAWVLGGRGPIRTVG
ncbi:hypothetical protein M3T53_07280 [Actinomyces sp. B33]|uniref:hypothetical protein n=1 Tax=Actinomyces sp. B33 TaxID=2942131 RepID=UPI002341F2A5|nr:hypothetical protein [Actinomyces sp. B33]MDC4233507.1 hypothetical protein [Actinomyces sp. B33]